MKRSIEYVLIIVAVCLGTRPAGAVSPVVTYNGGPAHTGYYGSAPLRELKGLKWKYDTGAGQVTSPLLAFGGTLFFGDGNGWFHAVDIQSGKAKWKFNAGKAAAGCPTIFHDRAYWGCGAGILYVLDPGTGTELRRFETAGRVENRDGSICFPPLVHDGVVYFTSHDGCLYALDADSLELKFTFNTDSSMCCSPSLDGHLLFFSTASGYVYAMDLSKRAVIWRFKAGGKVYHSPAIAGGIAYFCSHDRFLYAVEVSTGKEVWKFEADDRISAVNYPSCSNGMVFFGSGGSVYALE